VEITFAFLAILVIFIFVMYKTPRGRGWTGEFLVRFVLGKNCPKKDIFVINNLMFYDGTKSVQIDHVLINKYGIHIVETKNYAGYIYGKESDSKWIQVLRYGKVKKSFYNPIKQNNGHLYSLKQVMPIKVPLYSYIVFTGRATLKIKDCQTPVIYPIRLNRTIKKAKAKGYEMKPLEVRKVYETLKTLKKNNNITHEEHVKSIHQRKTYRKEMYPSDRP
jgi:type II secretory pathway component PulC